MEVAGGYVKEIWLVSGWAMGWQVKTSTYKIQTPGNYPEENIQQINDCLTMVDERWIYLDLELLEIRRI
jgi:hypothetical protein